MRHGKRAFAALMLERVAGLSPEEAMRTAAHAENARGAVVVENDGGVRVVRPQGPAGRDHVTMEREFTGEVMA